MKFKTFFNAEIKPRLIQLAVDGKLPLDMTQISWELLFPKESDQFQVDIREAIGNAECYLDPTDVPIHKQVQKIRQRYADGFKDYDIDYINGVTSVDQFAFTFTVGSFLDTIGYPVESIHVKL